MTNKLESLHQGFKPILCSDCEVGYAVYFGNYYEPLCDGCISLPETIKCFTCHVDDVVIFLCEGPCDQWYCERCANKHKDCK